MYFLVKFRDSGNIYLAEEIESRKGVLRILDHIKIKAPEQQLSTRNNIHLKLFGTGITYLSGGDEILGIAALEKL